MNQSIDFFSKENFFLFNPKQRKVGTALHQIVSKQSPNQGRVFVATSGSTGHQKIAVLKKETFLTAAESVNLFLEATSKDIWLNPLPLFHVGGLSTHARAQRNGSKVFSFDGWDPTAFLRRLQETQATLTSLVPTQLYDLTINELRAPPTLRHCLIGGGVLEQQLAHKAQSLGWPLVASYGMTETAAMIAGRKLLPGELNQTMTLLRHVEARTTRENRLSLKGTLFEGYLSDESDEVIDPKSDGWFLSDDLAVLEEQGITPIGRITDLIKIRGELFDLDYIRKSFNAALPFSMRQLFYIHAHPHPRIGFELFLCCTLSLSEEQRAFAESSLKKMLPPFVELKTFLLETLPFNELGKLQKEVLVKQIEAYTL